MAQIILTKKEGYIVKATDDERGPSHVKGLYQSYNKACTGAKGIGWYGGDGSVEQQDYWMDEINGVAYIIGSPIYLSDDEEAQRKLKLKKLREKIGDDDLLFLLENMKGEEILKMKQGK